jgi:hypothetical protein
MGKDLFSSLEVDDPDFDAVGIQRGMDYLVELHDRGYLHNLSMPRAETESAASSFMRGDGGFFIGNLSKEDHWKDISDAIGPENCGYFPSWIVRESRIPRAQLVHLVDVGFGIGTDSVDYGVQAALEYIRSFAVGLGAVDLLWSGILSISADRYRELVTDTYPVAESVIDSAFGNSIVPFPALRSDGYQVSGEINELITATLFDRTIPAEQFAVKLQNAIKE